MTRLDRRVRRKFRRVALSAPNAVRRRRGIDGLHAAGDPGLAQIGDAITAAARCAVDERERRWLDAIESVRAELLASSDTIDVRIAELTGDRSDERVVVENVAHACGRSKDPRWCVLLFELVRKLRPATSVELGTGLGISSAYQGAALELNERGRLVTLEAVEGHVAIARESFKRLGLGRVDARHGRFEDLLSRVMSDHAPVNLVFVDGNHTQEATLRYAETIKPFLAEGAVVIYDDISFSDEMERAWETLAGDADIGVAIDFGPLGLCVYRRRSRAKRLFNVPLAVKPKALDRGWLQP